jgi:hypothetical protein
VFSTVSRFAGFGAYGDRFYYISTGVVASRQLTSDFHFTAMAEARKTDTATSAFQRVSNRVSLGVTYSPGSIPLSLR